jgi:aspartate/methionine/tyrosine aminotransferase
MRILGDRVLSPPIRLVQGWGADFQGTRSLLDVSQGTSGVLPPRVPPADLESWVSYGEREGTPRLREALAQDVREQYATENVTADDVLVTAGCNEAFCAISGALLARGDRAVLLSPYYFNHDMWLRLLGVEPTYLTLDFDGNIDESLLEEAANGSQAIIAASPSNPTGAELSPTSLRAIERACRKYDIPFILDETYSVFRRDVTSSAHNLFDGPWRDYLISLRSLSKEFSMPGHRVGAAFAGKDVLASASKWHDCMSIVAPSPGQAFGGFALENLRDWRADLATTIRGNSYRFVNALGESSTPFSIDSWGGFFVWLEHPWKDRSDEDAARHLAKVLGVLTVPGAYFSSGETGRLRVSTASLTLSVATDLVQRLGEAGKP